MCKAGFACLFTSRCVPLCGWQAQDARHLGRYGPGGQFSSMAVACARRVLPVTMHLALCSLLWFAGPDGSQAHDPCIMAVWTGRTVAGFACFRALRAVFPGS